MAKNPLVAGLITLAPNIIKSVSSIIKDKRERKREEKKEFATTEEKIIDSVEEVFSGEISSKRVLNIAGTGLIITVAINDISTKGLNGLNLALISIGVGYSLLMSLITWLSEKK